MGHRTGKLTSTGTVLGAAWLCAMVLFAGWTLFDMFSPVTYVAFGEDQLLVEANARIQTIRRGTYLLDLGAGNASNQVTIRQISHAFKFGSNSFQWQRFEDSQLNQKYAENFQALFNYATLPFYWRWYEPTQGSYPEDPYLHSLATWCDSSNITPKGHPLTWRLQEVDWLKGVSNKTETVLARNDRILTTFPEIKLWDLCNELIHESTDWFGPSATAADVWETTLARARAIRPNAQYILNEYNTIIGEDELSGPSTFYQLVQKIKADGYTPDALGFQFHATYNWHPLQEILDTFDWFGSFKIPCHVTEFIPTSNGTYRAGSRRGYITEETQAEWAVRAYKILFSHPALDAITWWDFSNAPNWQAWKYEDAGYMMDETGRLLPVYNALSHLIHEDWNSTTTVTLDTVGKINFTGFYGDYVVFIDNNPTKNFSIVDTQVPSERPWRIEDIN